MLSVKYDLIIFQTSTFLLTSSDALNLTFSATLNAQVKRLIKHYPMLLQTREIRQTSKKKKWKTVSGNQSTYTHLTYLPRLSFVHATFALKINVPISGPPHFRHTPAPFPATAPAAAPVACRQRRGGRGGLTLPCYQGTPVMVSLSVYSLRRICN